MDTIDYHVWLDNDIRITLRCPKSNGPWTSERDGVVPVIEDAYIPGDVIAIEAPGERPDTVIMALKLANAFRLDHVNWRLPVTSIPPNQ